MKIGIVSYFFYPAINPRSFRAFELAKEFARLQHDVTVFVPDFGFDYAGIETAHSFHVRKVKPGFWLNTKERLGAIQAGPAQKSTATVSAPPRKKSLLLSLKIAFTRWFLPGGFNFEFAWTCAKALKEEGQPFDLLVSIGLPINSHLAVAKANRWKKRAAIKIADYGDPYSFSRIINPPYFHRWLERRMLRPFDYILTPTPKAIASFRYFKPEERIKVIPQGFNMTDVRLAGKVQNDVVTFVFAGNFYKDVREPDELLRFLSGWDKPFKFILFMNDKDPVNLALIEPYRQTLKDRLEIHPLLEREACIFEMSKADFLVNISNKTDEHSPSKLIDYCLTQRPIFSYVPGKFNAETAACFMLRDYRHDIAPSIDISAFDIRHVARQILDLTISNRP